MSLTQEIRRLWESLEGRGVLGQQVRRAAAPMGAPLTPALFNVFVGEILVTVLYGICTVDETGGAITARFNADAAVGGAVSFMCAATSFAAADAGDMLSAQGDLTAVAAPAAGHSGCGATLWMPYLCKVGTIGLTLSAGTANSSWRWVLCYIPLTNGAYVTAT